VNPLCSHSGGPEIERTKPLGKVPENARFRTIPIDRLAVGDTILLEIVPIESGLYQAVSPVTEISGDVDGTWRVEVEAEWTNGSRMVWLIDDKVVDILES
jgi:hypothetical protein